MAEKDTIISGISCAYKDARWAKREFNLEAYLSKYPQYAQRIKEAIEDYEFSLAARGLDKVIEASKSAAEIWDELLPRLREAFEKKTS